MVCEVIKIRKNFNAKQIKEKKREHLFTYVTKHCAIHLYITQKITLKCKQGYF